MGAGEDVKIFPAGSDLSEVEAYLAGDRTPKFVVSKPEEMAKKFIRDVSRRGVDYFAPYRVDGMPFQVEWLVTTKMAMPTIDRWRKPSVFWFEVDYAAKRYMAILLVAKYGDMSGNYPNTGTTPEGWVTRSQFHRTFHEDDKIDLETPHKEDLTKEERQELILVVLSTVVHVMQGIMDRPDEFVQSHGMRSRLDVARGKPAVVTISLSQPRKIYERHPNAPPSGIHMPLHAVRGHWRTLKSGKQVWVQPHERGDPDVPRRSITRVIP